MKEVEVLAYSKSSERLDCYLVCCKCTVTKLGQRRCQSKLAQAAFREGASGTRKAPALRTPHWPHLARVIQ